MSLSHNTFRDLGARALIDSLVGYLGLPLMVKPQHGGSALGASVVRSAEELPAALVGAFAYGDIVVVEVFVDGVELAITVVEEADGARALPAVEIAPSSGIFDYESRYTAGLTTYFTPARLSDEVAAAAADLAIGAHRVLGLRDVSRTDAIAAAGRHRAFPRGERVAGADRDVDAADVGGGGRPGPGRAVRESGRAGDRRAGR